MRRADEFTYKRMTSFIMVHSEPGKDKFTCKEKWLYKHHIRYKLLKYAKKLPAPPSRCKIVPRNPTAMVLQHKELYRAALGDATPGKCIMEMIDVVDLDNSSTCRT